MAYVAPSTRSTGDLITAAIWNQDAVDNVKALKAEVDTLSNRIQRDGTTIAYANPAGTRVDDTIYRNTSGYDRIVTISVQLDDGEEYNVECDSATPPTIVVAELDQNSGQPNDFRNVTFIVPDDYYYNIITVAGAPSIEHWTEWDRV